MELHHIINSIDAAFGALPLPLLEVWGRLAYFIGLALAISAFGGFTFRPGGRWGFGRESQAWDSRAFLSIPITFILIVVTGYVGSFIVLVPGAQTFESLKDLMVFLCIVLFGYPALIAVPIAYGLSDLIEGVPPEFLLDWLPGYFINPACFWVAYQLIGRNPDFRRARTWAMYLLFVMLFMAIEPQLWGYICAGKFTLEVSYRNITSALFFTTSITWIMAPFAMLAALPIGRRTGMFWAEIPGHVKERLLGSRDWVWESGGDGSRLDAAASGGWPLRMVVLIPFTALTLLMVGATAYVTLRSAEDDATKLATRLHQEISDNINLLLDDYLAQTQPGAVDVGRISALLKAQPISQHGIALIVDLTGKVIASTAEQDNPVAARAAADLNAMHASSEMLKSGLQFQFDHVTEKPLSRITWLARATGYQDQQGGHNDWIVLTVMPESYYLAGVKMGNSRSAMVFALALLLAMTAAALIAGTLTNRLRSISRAAEALAEGDLAQRLPESRVTEVGTLARSFNDMAGQLKKSIDALLKEVETRKSREAELEVSEQKFRTSEDRLSLAVMAGNLGIWDWDVEKNRLVWDDATYQLYGVRKDEFGGAYEAWSKCLAPEDLARATGDVEAALRGEREFASEFKVRLKDGSVRFIRGVAQTIRGKDGRPLRMVGINWDVTEQLMAERAVRERETFLRLAQEAAHVGSWEWEVSSSRFKWSDELARMHGITSAEFDGRLETIISFCHPRDVEHLRESMSKIVKGADSGGFECRIVRRDGIERDLWFLGQTSFNEHGTPARVLGIAIDITERKRRDILLADETRILGMIATGATLAEVLKAIVLSIEAISKDTIGSILLLDSSGLRLRQGAAPNLPDEYNRAIDGGRIGPKAGSCGTAAHRREPVIVIDIETDNLWEDYRGLARQHGLRACWSAPIMHSRGTVLGTFAMYYREPRSPGAEDFALIQRAIHLAGVAIERKQGEEENRKLMHALGERVKEQTCLRRVAEILQDNRLSTAEWIERIALVLPAGWQYPENTAVRIAVGDTSVASPGFTTTPWMQRAGFSLSNSTRVVIEVAFLGEKPDGVEEVFLPEERLLIDSLAEMLRSALDRRRLEEQFRQAQKMEAVGHLAAGVAHDFNNLLTVISGYSELLLCQFTLPDAQRQKIEAIHQAGQRASSLTKQLLAFSRKTILQPKVLDLNDVVRETELMLRRLIGEDVSLATVLQPDCNRIKADPGQLGQALLNLSVNARDAMPKGGKLTIETRNVTIGEDYCKLHTSAKPGNYVLLAVTDTGCGMTPEVRARIFVPFFTTKEVGKGTGLGLSMVYGIVEQSGGYIEVYSEVNVGTTFKLYFPTVDAQTVATASSAAIPIRRGSETVLLVEDEEGVRGLSLLALETHGYSVLTAVDGKDAIRVADEHGKGIDMLVTDVVMPGMGGPALAESMRAKFPGMRVLFVSGYTDDAVVRHGLLHEEVEFLHKPFTLLALLKKVRDVLDSK